MAKGKVRLLAAPRNRGWYVVTVSEVTAGKVAPEDPRLVGLQADLQNSVGSEYAGQLRYGMRTTVGTTRNEANTKQLKKQLEGSK